MINVFQGPFQMCLLTQAVSRTLPLQLSLRNWLSELFTGKQMHINTHSSQLNCIFDSKYCWTPSIVLYEWLWNPTLITSERDMLFLGHSPHGCLCLFVATWVWREHGYDLRSWTGVVWSLPRVHLICTGTTRVCMCEQLCVFCPYVFTLLPNIAFVMRCYCRCTLIAFMIASSDHLSYCA